MRHVLRCCERLLQLLSSSVDIVFFTACHPCDRVFSNSILGRIKALQKLSIKKEHVYLMADRSRRPGSFSHDATFGVTSQNSAVVFQKIEYTKKVYSPGVMDIPCSHGSHYMLRWYVRLLRNAMQTTELFSSQRRLLC